MKANLTNLVLVAMLLGVAPVAHGQVQDPRPSATHEIIPGSELMTPRERERYRQRVRAAKNPDEASRIRGEHVKQMQERARLRGLRLEVPRAEANK